MEVRVRLGELVVYHHNKRYFIHICDGDWTCRRTEEEVGPAVGLLTPYCKLVIIRHVPIFAIFVSALNDEFTY